jgi:hypothetical protein
MDTPWTCGRFKRSRFENGGLCLSIPLGWAKLGCPQSAAIPTFRGRSVPDAVPRFRRAGPRVGTTAVSTAVPRWADSR